MTATDTTPSLESSTRRVKLARVTGVTGVTGVAGLVMLVVVMGSLPANIYASFTSDPDQTVTSLRSIDDAFDAFNSFAIAAGLIATLWFALGLALLLSAIRRLRGHRPPGGALRVGLRQRVLLEQLGRKWRALALRGPDHLVGQVAATWLVAGRSSPTSPGWGWA